MNVLVLSSFISKNDSDVNPTGCKILFSPEYSYGKYL
jgi:hypothetical protein